MSIDFLKLAIDREAVNIIVTFISPLKGIDGYDDLVNLWEERLEELEERMRCKEK